MGFGIALNLCNYFWLFWDCLEKYAHFQFRRGFRNLWVFCFFWDCLEKYSHFRFRRGSGIFGFVGFVGTVSRNMLISWPMGVGIFVFWGLSRKLVLRLFELMPRARSGCLFVLCIMRRDQDYTDIPDIRRLKAWIPGGGGVPYIYIYICMYLFVHLHYTKNGLQLIIHKLQTFTIGATHWLLKSTQGAGLVSQKAHHVLVSVMGSQSPRQSHDLFHKNWSLSAPSLQQHGNRLGVPVQGGRPKSCRGDSGARVLVHVSTNLPATSGQSLRVLQQLQHKVASLCRYLVWHRPPRACTQLPSCRKQLRLPKAVEP